MSDRDQQQSVENYTNAFLEPFGLLLFMMLLTIALVLGGLWMLLTAALVNQLITWRGRILGGYGCSGDDIGSRLQRAIPMRDIQGFKARIQAAQDS
jgi:hypothetical protein